MESPFPPTTTCFPSEHKYVLVGAMPVENGLIDGHIDHVAHASTATRSTAAFATQQRQRGAEGRVKTRQRVTHRKVGTDGGPIGKTVDMAEAAKGLACRSKPRLGCQWARLPVARDTRVDQPRIGLLELVRPKPPLLHRAWFEVLD
eukprot:scaffold32131_cov26-Tisochrysis_lutea.AAC.2